MSKERKIEELKRHLDKMVGNNSQLKAEKLYAIGYRRQGEVAREIFEEIEEAISAMEYNAKSQTKNATIPIDSMTDVVNWVLHEVVPNRISEIKKKYTEEHK